MVSFRDRLPPFHRLLQLLLRDLQVGDLLPQLVFRLSNLCPFFGFCRGHLYVFLLGFIFAATLQLLVRVGHHRHRLQRLLRIL